MQYCKDCKVYMAVELVQERKPYPALRWWTLMGAMHLVQQQRVHSPRKFAIAAFPVFIVRVTLL